MASMPFFPQGGYLIKKCKLSGAEETLLVGVETLPLKKIPTCHQSFQKDNKHLILFYSIMKGV